MTKKTPLIRRLPSSGAIEKGFPQGHVGHLNATEARALADFKALLTAKGLYQAGPPASHDDATLLRFLRARKWVSQDAYGQFSETERFRKENNVEGLYEIMDIDAFEDSKRLYPLWTGRRDRRGIPLYVYQIRHLDHTTVSKYEKRASAACSQVTTDGKTRGKLLHLTALYENFTRFVQPMATECTDRDHSETPITLSTNIVDVRNVSLKMFWDVKGHMQEASQLATGNYPETLDRIFVIGAPYFFSTIWGWIKRWFDPVTVSKIFILGQDDVLPVLSTFVDVKNIPAEYGGELDWKYFEEPRWDSELSRLIRWENGHTSLPPGPMYWRPMAEDGTRLELLAVGSKGDQRRKERIATMPTRFHSGQETGSETAVETPDPTESPAIESKAEHMENGHAVPAA